MTDGPPLVITHMTLYDLFRDPAFFARVPLFYFLKPQAEAVVARVVAAATGGDPGCGGCGNVRGLLLPLLEQFTALVRGAHRDCPEALEPLVAYLAGRLDKRPRPVTVYYKDAGRTCKIDL